jgi:hypothetical protein
MMTEGAAHAHTTSVSSRLSQTQGSWSKTHTARHKDARVHAHAPYSTTMCEILFKPSALMAAVMVMGPGVAVAMSSRTTTYVRLSSLIGGDAGSLAEPDTEIWFWRVNRNTSDCLSITIVTFIVFSPSCVGTLGTITTPDVATGPHAERDTGTTM